VRGRRVLSGMVVLSVSTSVVTFRFEASGGQS
jgi:hypothetical protein